MKTSIDRQKGVSLIMTFFIMIIILSVVLFISVLLYGEVKIARNMGNSVVSLYAADSGIEKVLYYDRQVLPILSSGPNCDADNPCPNLTEQTCVEGSCVTYAKRGLCSIYDVSHNPDACVPFSSVNTDVSTYCAPNEGFDPPKVGTKDPIHGCDPDVCDDCQISFSTNLDNGASYISTAQVSPAIVSTNFDVESKGIFGDAERQVKVSVFALSPENAINISGVCVTGAPSIQQGDKVYICASVTPAPGDTIGEVKATVRGLFGSVPVNGHALLTSVSTEGACPPGDYAYLWNTISASPDDYSVDIYAEDNTGPVPVTKTVTDALLCDHLWPYFEIRGGAAYPTLLSTTVNPLTVAPGDSVTITANATDVSGISSMTVTIDGQPASNHGSMQSVGGDDYTTSIDVSYLAPGVHTVGIIAVNNLLQQNPPSVYSNVGSFTISSGGGPSCSSPGSDGCYCDGVSNCNNLNCGDDHICAGMGNPCGSDSQCVNAKCGIDADHPSCGGLTASCTSNNDCDTIWGFHCGSDNTCGGFHATCAFDWSCQSNSCSDGYCD